MRQLTQIHIFLSSEAFVRQRTDQHLRDTDDGVMALETTRYEQDERT